VGITTASVAWASARRLHPPLDPTNLLRRVDVIDPRLGGIRHPRQSTVPEEGYATAYASMPAG
jgi:hypothetical protein